MIISGEKLKNFTLRWSGVIVFLILWEAAPRLNWIDPYFLPPFSVVISEIAVLFGEGGLGIHLVVSLWRALSGFLTALLLGLPLGFVFGRWLVGASEALHPVLVVLSQVNPFTMLPVFVFFFGIGEFAKIMVLSWVSFWPVMFYTVTASRSIDPIRVKTAASMGISGKDLFLKVVLPISLPTIFTGIRISAGLIFFILTASEMLGASSGLGFLVHNSAMKYQIPSIYAGATFIVLLGFLLNRSLLYIESRLFPWREKVGYIPGTVRERTRMWLPGRKRVAAAIAALLILSIIVFGSLAVRVADKGTAKASTEEGKHSRHSGQPVDGE